MVRDCWLSDSAVSRHCSVIPDRKIWRPAAVPLKHFHSYKQTQTPVIAVFQPGSVNYFHVCLNWLRLPQTVSMSGRGAILFSLSVFCEPCRAPKLDASDWFYCGLSSPLGIVADVRPCSPCLAGMRRCFWRILFLSL